MDSTVRQPCIKKYPKLRMLIKVKFINQYLLNPAKNMSFIFKILLFKPV